MKKLITLISAIALSSLLLGGCATNRAELPHIPGDVEVKGLEVNINTPWGGTTTVKVDEYKSVKTDTPSEESEAE